jgi:hypothetical protein
MWMYRGLSDPRDALAQFAARPADLKIEEGNSLTNAYVWLSALDSYGHVDRAMTADAPLFAVFTKDGRRTHVAWNLGSQPRTVTFSDGVTVKCQQRSVGVQ